MQNWDSMQPAANYDQHNSWYNSMFAANIKTEPGTISPPQSHSSLGTIPAAATTATQLENYLKQHHQQFVGMDTMTAMTPSPSNNDSLHHFFDSSIQQQLLQQQQYQHQFKQAQQAAAHNQVTASHLPLGFNPLTPPGLPSAVVPTMTHFYNQSNVPPGQQTPSPQPLQSLLSTTPIRASSTDRILSALTPRNTPPMDVTPPKSPKPLPQSDTQSQQDQALIPENSEHLKYMVESEDDDNIRLPVYNSHGKMKNYKCKTCGQINITKLTFWEHTKSHMKPDKILQCPKCPFATELKHHLEYHIRKHTNLKPFQCENCSYTCVNKSMLNSHRKSHSSIYQYRCSECDYATKYCHSFKLHLRKQEHKPGIVLDEEGKPNPSVVIDVYGTRRGPKNKGGGKRSNSVSKNQQGNEKKVPTSKLSAALQGLANPQQEMPASPANSTNSNESDLPPSKVQKQQEQQQNLQQQQQKHHKQQKQQQQQKQQHQQHQQQLEKLQQQQQLEQLEQLEQLQQQQQQLQKTQTEALNAQAAVQAVAQQSISSLMPPLASILQQNHSMAFFPYWNLNLQMLAAQQQFNQLSPSMRETALQQLQNQNFLGDGDESAPEDEANDDCDHSIDSAMDLSRSTPCKEEMQSNEFAINLKLQEDSNDTPLFASRSKGRVLQLEALLQAKSDTQSPTRIPDVATNVASTVPTSSPTCTAAADESMEASASAPTTVATASPNAATSNTSGSPAASSSGNSSTSSSSGSRTSIASSISNGTIHECKYCDIYFKDAVLYTIHMGYHSCDDAFKCNMCGEKCDGPIGLFVHMARNAHS